MLESWVFSSALEVARLAVMVGPGAAVQIGNESSETKCVLELLVSEIREGSLREGG